MSSSDGVYPLVTCYCLCSSNCVVNLAHDKLSVLKGAYNALKVSVCACVCVSIVLSTYSPIGWW